jgi:predicted RecB family nuclease
MKLRKASINTISELIQSQWSEGSGMSKSKFRDLQQQAKAQKLNEILLRSRKSLEKIAVTSKNAICLTFFRHIQPVNGSFTFFMGMLTAQGRFECLNITDSTEEKAGFKRITDFFIRYLDHFPDTVVYTFSQADLSLVHDLSNRYNICHDDVDDLIYKEKLVALQPALRQSLTLPVRRYGLNEVLNVLDPAAAKDADLAKSPQILYDLFDSGSVESELERINSRGRLELEAMLSVLKNSAALCNAEFPVKVEECDL